MDNVDLRLECYRMALDAGFELGDVRAEAQRIYDWAVYDWAVGVKTGMKSDASGGIAGQYGGGFSPAATQFPNPPYRS